MIRLVALALLLAGCDLGGGDTRWATARRGELVIGVDVSGQLASTESHLLGPPAINQLWNFKIAFMPPEGASAQAGQPVIGFDPQELTARLEEYRNEADSATKELAAHRAASRLRAREAALAIAQAEAGEKKAELAAEVGEGIEATKVIEKARLDLELARVGTAISRRIADARAREDRAELERLLGVKRSAEERVAELGESLGKLRVPAPISGTVLHPEDWQGNKKKIGDSVWRAEKVVEVVSLEHMKAAAELDEMNASKVAAGQRATIRLDANADVAIEGAVAHIEEAVQQRSPTDPRKVVKLDITLDEQDKVELRPGMRFRGTVETDRVAGVLQVPLAAIHATPEGAVVYKKSGAGAEPVPVTLGRRGSDRVEITNGLVEGDQVALLDRAGRGAGDDETGGGEAR